jgi:hypothetical protein
MDINLNQIVIPKKKDNRLPQKILAFATFEPFLFGSFLADFPTVLIGLLVYSAVIYLLSWQWLAFLALVTFLVWYTAHGMQFFQKGYLIRHTLAREKFKQKISEAMTEYNHSVWGDE